jgi:MFS family permease
LTQPETLAMSSTAVGLLATVYLASEVLGAPFFGKLSDRLGRYRGRVDIWSTARTGSAPCSARSSCATSWTASGVTCSCP